MRAIYCRFNLPEPDRIGERFPHQVSGGQLQRAMVAMAYNPDLIVFDEPTTVLDVTTQIEVLATIKCDEITSTLNQLVAAEILKLLQRLQNGLGVLYLFITHDLATEKVISDEIVVMLEGRVVEHGTTVDILKPPHHEYTEMLLASVPEMDADWLDNLLKTRVGALLREGPASGHARQADE